MTIATILSNKGREVATIASDAPLSEVVRLLGEKRIGALLVEDGAEVAGIISERDVIYCLKDHGAQVLDWPVSRVMTSPAIKIELSTSINNAMALMTQQRIRHLPVVEGGQLQGIVSIGDLVKFRIDQIEQEAEAMRQYIAGDRY
jgi:CBS domain-containing protein